MTATYDDGSSKEVSGYTLSDNAQNLAVGEQTITVSYTENEVTKTDTITVTVTAPKEYPTKVTEVVDGQYVIASGLKAMSSEKHNGYTNESNYAYTGFHGKDITVSGNEITSDVANDLVWLVKQVSDGYTIQHLVSGKYLTATYTKNSGNDGYTGILTLTDTAEDTWILDSSFRLKSTKASQNDKGSTLYLTFDDKTDTIDTGEGNLFGIRSSSNDFANVDTIDFYALPTEVKGLDRIAVTTNPTKTTYEAGENFDKSGMVVTAYYSDNSSKAVTDYTLSGDKNLSAGTATITITYTENGFTRTTTVNVIVNGKPLTGNEPTKVTSIKDGQYVITSGKMAMTSEAHGGYTNNNDFAYSGFQGQEVTVESGKITAGATEDMTWEIRSISGGYSIKHVPTGKYLSASYTQNSGNNGYTGKLTLGDTIDTWVLDNDFHLKSTNASGNKGLYLTFDDNPDEIKSGSADLFGIRSDSNMDNVDVMDFYLIKEVTGGDNPGSGDATYIAFSSDVHNNETSANAGSAGRLNNWITNVTNKIGATFKTMSFSGDSGDSKAKNEDYWTRVQVVMDVVANNSGVSGNGNFTSGNHEWDSGNYGSLGSSNATAQKIKITGEAEKANDYIIYAFGATSSDQSGTGYKDADITNLDSYLSSAPTDRPIFIIAHFPLHSASGNGQNRSTKNADKVISTLNQHGDTHDIYFIWGHNHTLANNGETNYDKVNTDKIGSTNIKFTYAAAGCMSDSEYSSGSHAVKGKGMVVKIENKQVKTMTYYDVDYNASYTYTNTVADPDECTHSNLTAVAAKEATCTETGNNAYYQCGRCDAVFQDANGETPTTVEAETIAALGHDLKLVPAKDSTCTEAGNNAYYQCGRCDAVFQDADGETPSTVEDETLDFADHTLKAVFDPDTKTHTLSCDNCDHEVVEACSFSSEITTEATEEHNGVKAFTCSVCHGSYEEEFAYIPPELEESIARVSGKTRYETSMKIADTLKSELGVETFGTILVANGENFPDALAGSYLATMKNAPILLTSPSRDSEICEYIVANLSKNGTVYILGGTASVSKEFADQLSEAGIKTIRLSGKTRYETSLEILKEAKLNGKEILVCTGENFADALSVSALNKPILLVNGKKTELTSEQVQYLDSLGGGYTFYLIGGDAAINNDLAEVLEAYGTVERISGKARENTAVAVARKFFPEASLVTLAYSRNYPDGLCGGSLAYQLGVPLLLVADGTETAAAEYVESNGIEKGIVFGGTAGITNDSLKIVFPGETVG